MNTRYNRMNGKLLTLKPVKPLNKREASMCDTSANNNASQERKRKRKRSREQKVKT